MQQRIPVEIYQLSVWDKMYLFWEKRWYEIKAKNERYIIATKPHFKTVLYTIIDLVDRWMWPDNYVFSNNWYEDIAACEKALKDLTDWKYEISQRRWCDFQLPIKIISNNIIYNYIDWEYNVYWHKNERKRIDL